MLNFSLLSLLNSSFLSHSCLIYSLLNLFTVTIRPISYSYRYFVSVPYISYRTNFKFKFCYHVVNCNKILVHNNWSKLSCYESKIWSEVVHSIHSVNIQVIPCRLHHRGSMSYRLSTSLAPISILDFLRIRLGVHQARCTSPRDCPV